MKNNADRKEHRTKTQHYVAQFYLGGFANEKKMMFCFDKVQGRSYPTSTKAAAQEPYFYEIAPGTTKNQVPLNEIENKFSAIEGYAANFLKELISFAKKGRIPHDLLGIFCDYVALQWMRTKTYRDLIREMATKSVQSFVDELTNINFPDVAPPRFSLGEKGMPALHAEHMFGASGMIERISNDLQRQILIVGINSTDRPFYTSDHPVVRHANLYEGIRPMLGLRDPGAEYAFPLDSQHILLILERTYHRSFQQFDARSMTLNEAQIEKYNQMQVRRSCQRIYCIRDDFDLANNLCKAEPSICDPNRSRVIAGATPIVPDGENRMKNFTYVISLE